MRKVFTYICIISVIVLMSSCLSNSGIVKRRYEKGFFVEAFGGKKYNPAIQKQKTERVNNIPEKKVDDFDGAVACNSNPVSEEKNFQQVVNERRINYQNVLFHYPVASLRVERT